MSRRLALSLAVLALLLLAVLTMRAPRVDVTIQNPLATLPVEGAGLLMVTMELINAGDAAILERVTVPDAAGAQFSSPHLGPMVLPAGDSVTLAMESAHILLLRPPERFVEGSFLPLTLHFRGGGEVTTRLLHGGIGAMDHGMMEGVDVRPLPTVTLRQEGPFSFAASVENLSLKRVAEGSPHVDGEGHGHVYLNGLKLGRLYSERIEIGRLPEGAYTLRVALNGNDHRPYLDDNGPIAATLDFVVP